MKLRIRPRMMAGFLIMSALLIVVGIFAIFYTNRMQKNTSRILAENVSSQKASEELEIALLDMKGLTANYLLDGESKWLEVFSDKQASFVKWFDNAREQAHTLEEKKILDEVEHLFDTYLRYQKKVVSYYQQGNFSQAYEILTGDMRVTFNLIYEKCEELSFLNEKMMYHTSFLIERDNRTVNGMVVLGILAGLALGLFLARSITHPIYELVLKLKGATNEEIVEKVDIADETELEHLSKHVRKLIDKVHEVNKDLEYSQRMLIRSEKLASLGQMAAGVAHEIRNPLTAIKMLIFSLQKDVKNTSPMTKDFEVIIKEIERIETFLQNFLDFARPPKPNFDLMDINELVKQTLTLLSPQIKTGKVKLGENLQAKSATVYGDKEQLQIVLVNIILNALQSMSNGGRLKVETTNRQNPKGLTPTIQIRISDTGSGIPPEILDSIFDPFVTGREKGTGLGLSIAYQIINNHGGWIEAFNNPDKGATFVVNLPIKKGEKC
ncbi:MAG: ATP-binding protein [candidate division KSB1 bacterium]|nr:ATP-binding protein [candidate division KSB1 bacterium]